MEETKSGKAYRTEEQGSGKESGRAERQRTYFCIDMKCFFASVECAERGLDPFTTPLVVADETRGRAALCLAVTPKMKTLGVKNRCRLFEIDKRISYQIAKPRMKRYILYAADIYEIYLRYFSPEDIHVYSIDEAFIDATDYLVCYKKKPREFVQEILSAIAREKGIPATAGIGSNLYLAKVALDILAKHAPGGIACLDESSYREKLWRHQPITDFWQVASGTAKRLARYGICDMQGVAHASEGLLYRLFGVNAELLIDHAWGRESCTMADIHRYRSKSRSLCFSQVLPCDYSFDQASVVVKEMLHTGCQEMLRQKVVSDRISLWVGYAAKQEGERARVLSRASSHAEGTLRLTFCSNLYSAFRPWAEGLFERIADRSLKIRRLSLCFYDLADEDNECYDLFADIETLERERKLAHTVLRLGDRFGKNALLRGSDLQKEATARERNRLIGGHNGE